ncbi:hypothetical protein Tco_0328586 [Tanacetum coccineum]
MFVALRGELYFVKFIINPEEDDFEPRVILGRSFLRLAKGVVDFGNGVTTIYPEPDPFEDDYEKTGKSSDDWEQLFDFNFDDVPKPYSSARGHLTQEEVAKEALAIRITQKFSLLVEERTVIETMAYHDKYKKILDGDLEDKSGWSGIPYTMGSILNTPERVFSTFDGVCHQTFRGTRFNVLRTTESDSDDEEEYIIIRNKFRAPIYGPKPAPYLNLPLKQVNWKPDHKGCYTNEEEATGQWRTEIRLTDPLGGRAHNLTLLDFARRLGLYQAVELEEEGFNVYFEGGLALMMIDFERLGFLDDWYDKIQKNDLWLLSMFDARYQNGVLAEDVVRSLSAPIYCRDLDTITLRDLIDSEGKLILEDP